MRLFYWIGFRIGYAVRLIRLGYRYGAEAGSDRLRDTRKTYDAEGHSGSYPWL